MVARLHTYERLDAPKKINWREFFLLFEIHDVLIFENPTNFVNFLNVPKLGKKKSLVTR
jgi:hypothetical protein